MAEVTIRGIRSLRRKLLAMPGPIRDQTRQALEEGAEQIVAQMRNIVVKGRTRRLFQSIGWTWNEAPKGSIAVASAKIGENTLTIFAGDEVAYYARWVEFGVRPHSLTKGARIKKAGTQQGGPQHPGTRPQAFFFPIYRANKKEVKRRVNAAMRKALKQVAASGGATV